VIESAKLTQEGWVTSLQRDYARGTLDESSAALDRAQCDMSAHCLVTHVTWRL
jgi:hypothetical protein